MNLAIAMDQAKALLFPQVRCLSCDEPRRIDAGQALCPACASALDSLRIGEAACGLCLSPKRVDAPCRYCMGGGMAGISRAFSPYVYRDVARKLIVILKFGPVALAAQPLALEMALQVSGLRFDGLVPVPLHASRLRERGMNQSALLAQLVAEQTGMPVLDALKKTRKIARQSTLSAELRAENIKNSMATKAEVKGLSLLLIDDVRTTGATAREAAKVLRAAGAASVCLLSAAVAWHGNRHE